VGEGTTIGVGTNILNNVKVGKNSIIGAGSVVTKDIPDNVVAYGSPCKVIREV
jgi:acetyltransferase-like isoleucine patch superfamily enzyme